MKARTVRKATSVGYCYIISSPSGLFKIGRSVNPVSRMTQIAPTKSGLKLVAHVATGDMAWLERFLHEAFAHRRVKGEWFRLTGEEVGLLTAIPSADSIDDVPTAVAALHGLNAHNEFRWGERDDAAKPPSRTEGKVPVQFYIDDELNAALNDYLASLPDDRRPTKQAMFETALKEYLAARGSWPNQTD